MNNASQPTSVDNASARDKFKTGYAEKEDLKNHPDIGFNDIYNIQAAKPKILRHELASAEHQLEHDVAVELKKNGFVRDDIDKHLLKAEERYQAALNKHADYAAIAKAFERLPADRKIDLLEQAEHISTTNEQLRAEARAHLEASRAEAIARHEQEIARAQEAARQEQIAASPTSPTKTEVAATEHKWPVYHITADKLEQERAHFTYKASPDQNTRHESTHEKNYVGNFSAITFNYIPSKALPLVLTARVGLGVKEDHTGHQHLALKLTYVGAGLTVNRNSNVLFAPTGIKVPDVPLDGFGTLSTVMNRAAKPSERTMGQLHHQFNPGTKVTLTADLDDRKIFAAPEISYQKGGDRTIALTTAGYHWSKAGVSVAIEPVQNFIEKNVLDIKAGTLPQWADANLYSMQDLAVVGDRMSTSLGSVNLYAAATETAIHIVKRPTEIVAEKAAELKLAMDQAIPHHYQEKLEAELKSMPPDQLSIIRARILRSFGIQSENEPVQYAPAQSASVLSANTQSHER